MQKRRLKTHRLQNSLPWTRKKNTGTTDAAPPHAELIGTAVRAGVPSYMPNVPAGLDWPGRKAFEAGRHCAQWTKSTETNSSGSGGLTKLLWFGVMLICAAGLLKGIEYVAALPEQSSLTKTEQTGEKPEAIPKGNTAEEVRAAEIFAKAIALRRGTRDQPKDPVEAARLLKEIARLGYVDAQAALGEMLFEGEAGPRDELEAAAWFGKAAEQGHGPSEHALGLIYAKGAGVDVDHTVAAGWFQKAAQHGHAAAQNRMGLIHVRGKGVEQDYSKALIWFKTAAENGDVAALHNVGVVHVMGLTGMKNAAEALRWFRQAAERGYLKSQVRLSQAYFQGVGVPKDYDEAAKWAQKAADQGNAKAQNLLGVFHTNGFGVTKNLMKAYEWYEIAAAGGAENAQENRDFIANKLTAREIAAAARNAREWLAARRN